MCVGGGGGGSEVCVCVAGGGGGSEVCRGGGRRCVWGSSLCFGVFFR